MINIDARLNQVVKVPFAEANGTTGLTTFPVTILKDGEVSATPIFTFDEVGGGIYTAEATFLETGLYTIIIDGRISAVVNVVEKVMYDILNDLDDVGQGSWIYDKSTGVLRLIRQDGNDLATFNVVDDPETSSRERL